MEVEGKSEALANGLGDFSFSVQSKNHCFKLLLISAHIMATCLTVPHCCLLSLLLESYYLKSLESGSLNITYLSVTGVVCISPSVLVRAE